MDTHVFKLLQASEAELTLRLDEATKLAQELSDRKKELKAAMYNNKLASFNAFPGFGDASLGELAFAHIQLPFKRLDMAATTELKLVAIDIDSDFVLALDHGQRILVFKTTFGTEYSKTCLTQMSCFDRLGRLIGIKIVDHICLGNVVQCGDKEFIVYHEMFTPELSVYNSSLHRLRRVD